MLQYELQSRINNRQLQLGYLHKVLSVNLKNYRDELIQKNDKDLFREFESFNLEMAHNVLECYLTRCQHMYSR